MNPLPNKPTRYSLASAWSFIKCSGVFAGCAVAILIISCGRTFLAITTSTLSGWTALFFVALFTGVSVANLRSINPFASSLQMLGFAVGAGASIGALVTLQYALNGMSDVLLGVSGAILIPSILGIRPSPRAQNEAQDPSLVGLALRLDDLMKYELPHTVRTQLAAIIDNLCQSPPDQSDFIPVQHDQLDHLVTDLEIAIRSGFVTEAIETSLMLSRCLDERNRFLNRAIEIEYRNITDTNFLPAKSESPLSGDRR